MFLKQQYVRSGTSLSNHAGRLFDLFYTGRQVDVISLESVSRREFHLFPLFLFLLTTYSFPSLSSLFYNFFKNYLTNIFQAGKLFLSSGYFIFNPSTLLSVISFYKLNIFFYRRTIKFFNGNTCWRNISGDCIATFFSFVPPLSHSFLSTYILPSSSLLQFFFKLWRIFFRHVNYFFGYEFPFHNMSFISFPSFFLFPYDVYFFPPPLSLFPKFLKLFDEYFSRR